MTTNPDARGRWRPIARHGACAAALALPLLVAGCSPGPDPSPTASSGQPTVTSTPSDTASAEATPGAFDGDQSWIAYYGRVGTHLVHPDGTDDHDLAFAIAGHLILANWSPDGARLIMTSRDTGGTEPIYEYDLANDELRQPFACEDPCIGDDEPVYSPDGTHVLFVRALGPFVDDQPSSCGLWLGDLTTGEVEEITSTPGCSHRETFAHWSPDGTQLVYYRGVYDNGVSTASAVYVLDVATHTERQVTDPALFAGDADWSVDGEWIFFSTYPLNDFQCCQVSNLYRVRPDGTGLEQLTDNPSDATRATQPRATPDGKWILFTQVTPTSRGLWVLPVDGGEPVAVAPAGLHTHGTWQPAVG
jgi:Tol biopolymer transport system component